MDDDLFRFVGELEISKAVRLRYPVSVLSVIMEPAESEPDAETLDRARFLGTAASDVVREVDLVNVPADGRGFRVLLVDASFEDVDGIARRIRGTIAGLSRPRTGAACFPTTARSFEELIAAADAAARSGTPRELPRLDSPDAKPEDPIR